jgi:hypothetical protein
MFLYIVGYFVIGLISAVIVFGWYFAYWQRKYPSIAREHCNEDYRHAMCFAIITFFAWPSMWLSILLQPLLQGTKLWEYGFKFSKSGD